METYGSSLNRMPPVSLLDNIQRLHLAAYIYLLKRNKLFVCCLYYPSFAFLHLCQNSKPPPYSGVQKYIIDVRNFQHIVVHWEAEII